MKFINKIVDFPEILISWQEPYKEGVQRQRYKIAILHKKGNDATLEYLLDTKDFQVAKEKGFTGIHRISIMNVYTTMCWSTFHIDYLLKKEMTLRCF